MKRFFPFLCFFFVIFSLSAQNKVFTTYLWHMQQPIYWPEKSLINPNRYQTVKESQDIKNSGGNDYGTGTSHPLSNLEEIFSKPDRVQAYQTAPREAVNSILSFPDAGAQVNYSGCLIENVNSLAQANQWGYASGWQNNFITAHNWTTSDGYPRLDIVGFTFHHALSPLVSERALRMEIKAHKLIYQKTFGVPYSQGYWPAECAFSERIIKILVEEGFKWSVVANSHLARVLQDYPLHYGTDGCNIDPPNKADVLPVNGKNWWSGQIGGRGGTFAVPFCYQPHKAKYVDPQTGQEYVITVVPMADLLSFKDGYGPMTTDDLKQHILPYSNANNPSLVLLAHDGDNFYAGGWSYYHEAVKNFVSAVESDAYMAATTVDQFLHDYPVSDTDIIHVEDGAWVNPENDWGHPQFINWLWPLYNSQTYEFDPQAWTEDARNWAVITAVDNFVCTAEDLSDHVDIADIVYPSDTSSAAEKAWHFYLPALTSGYMYYGTSADMEVKPTIAGNNAIAFAKEVLDAHPGQDLTPPSVFIPQRFPYNPGGIGFGPIYSYKQHINSCDFTVWTFVYDVSGLESVVLKYRLDKDGVNPLSNNENETYNGGNGVGQWLSIPMTRKVMDPAYNGNNPNVDFFVLPEAIADLYYAAITGLKDTLVDYYVEATDKKGNVFRSPIQHVWVGDGGESLPHSSYIYWTPEDPSNYDKITIVDSQATANSYLHWGVCVDGQDWTAPIEAYYPEGTVSVDNHSVETPFTDPDGDGVYSVTIGPFNNPQQEVEKVNFVIKLNDNTWDNNGGNDYSIELRRVVSENPQGYDISIKTYENRQYIFSADDFVFNSYTGAGFGGIRVITLPQKGHLDYDGQTLTDSADCPDVGLLVFTPDQNQIGMPYTAFSFRVMDDQGRVSDAIYTCTVYVDDLLPLGANSEVMLKKNQEYVFSCDDFPFVGKDGASFEGIKIIRNVDRGSLLFNGNEVMDDQVCNDVSQLVFVPQTDDIGTPYTEFLFRVIDSGNRLSRDTYTMVIDVVENYPTGVSWVPEHPTVNDRITIIVAGDTKMDDKARLHWGVNGWKQPIQDYWVEGSVLFNGTGPALESPFHRQDEGVYIISVGPFNNANQLVNTLDFVLHYGDDTWNNNSGNDWHINIEQGTSTNVGMIEMPDIKVFPVPFHDYATVDMMKISGKYTISLMDLKGHLLAKTQVIAPTKFWIKRGHLPTGVYMINFAKDTGEVYNKTLIIR